eukprot:TRINITY_DN19913_c0_g1_i1.p2 TRINITY_DN19913_c0_g1~~TRINITY_DN19913_c0_g1_i1.p2  ORF type:complete len:125 (-),score=4.38 TRINITY_DN19913_c0_g1_i1:706-1080(-)
MAMVALPPAPLRHKSTALESFHHVVEVAIPFVLHALVPNLQIALSAFHQDFPETASVLYQLALELSSVTTRMTSREMDVPTAKSTLNTTAPVFQASVNPALLSAKNASISNQIIVWNVSQVHFS